MLEALSDPEAAARVLLVPALLALVFVFVRDRSWAALASVVAASFALTVMHPNYTPLPSPAGGLPLRAALRASVRRRSTRRRSPSPLGPWR